MREGMEIAVLCVFPSSDQANSLVPERHAFLNELVKILCGFYLDVVQIFSDTPMPMAHFRLRKNIPIPIANTIPISIFTNALCNVKHHQ